MLIVLTFEGNNWIVKSGLYMTGGCRGGIET